MSEPVKNSVAFVIKSISTILGENPGKKTLQKLVFMIEEKGVDLNFEYGLHFYGPYSSSLDSATTLLSTDGIISFDYSGYAHRMEVNEKWDIESTLSKEQEDTIKDVITHFKGRSPSQLELLTTTIYAYNNLTDKSKDSVINGVRKIKGSKYSLKEIENALNELSYFNKLI